MANDEKVIIEVVLDDGSIKKSFATIKREAKQTQDDINNSGKGQTFVDVEAAKKAFDKIADGFGLVATAAATAAFAVKKAFDFALAGENVNAFEQNFDRLANSQGLVNLREQLEETSRGLVDVSDLLQVSTNAILNLGDAASGLPQVLDLATRAALSNGTNARETYETFIRAIETGNTRLLRQSGFIIDAEKVFKSYADTIGTSAGSLTLAQKQQALLNAVIEEGSKRASQFNENARPLNTSVTQLSVSISQLFENIQKTIASDFGGFFAKITSGVRSLIDDLNQFQQAQLNSTNNTAASLAKTRAEQLKVGFEIERITKLIAENDNFLFKRNKLQGYTLQLETLKKTYQELGEQIEKSGVKLSKFGERQDEIANKPTEAGKAPSVLGLTPEQIAENQRLRQQAASQVLTLEIQAAQAALQLKQEQLTKVRTAEEAESLLAQIRIDQDNLLKIQKEQELNAALDALKQNRLATDEQFEAARLAIEEKFKNQRRASDEEEQLRIIRQNENVGLSFEKLGASIVDYAKGIKVTYQQVGAAIFNALTNVQVRFFQSIGEALATGEDAFADFGKTFLSLIGDLAIQVGTLLITAGTAALLGGFATAVLGNGPGLIAAGGALVAFGGFLKAANGGAQTSVGTPGGGSGGGFGGGTIGGDFPEAPISDQIERQAPNTEVNVVIQGDVLDSEETGLRIVDLINRSFDKQGVIIKRGALA